MPDPGITKSVGGPQRIVILCAVAWGVDTTREICRQGIRPAAIVGLHGDAADPERVSGWVDIGPIGQQLGVPTHSIDDYSLGNPADRAAIEALQPDLIVIAGWQRLVPDWLLNLPVYGVIGSHGSPDGIGAGRGRSPQTWALLLGCDEFELSLFKVTPGIDDGPVLASRRFAYLAGDDIETSYARCSLAAAEMLVELVEDPARLTAGIPQSGDAFYYPQRQPQDGWADWSLESSEISRHARALSRPYPGLRCREPGGALVQIWRCRPFDDLRGDSVGTVGPCFNSGAFLVQCGNGRLIVDDWTSDGAWQPAPGHRLEGRSWARQLAKILSRHQRKYADLPVSPRITSHYEDSMSKDLSDAIE